MRQLSSRPTERIELPGYAQVEHELHLQAIFLDLLRDGGELGLSFRAQLQGIVERHCGKSLDFCSAVLIAEKDNIDITIEYANVVLLIELKWEGKEGLGQTELYEKVADSFYGEWTKVLLFVSRSGEHPAAKAWIPVKIVPSAEPWDPHGTLADARAVVKRHTSQALSKSTGIPRIAAMLGPDFPSDLCGRIESRTGIPHAVCPQYSTFDAELRAPHKCYSGGWYGAAPGRYLRLFERAMVETPEFYVACGDGIRMPFITSEILIDGLELRIKYQSFAKPDGYLPSVELAKRRLFEAVKPVRPELLLWIPKSTDLHYNLHQRQLLSRRDFAQLSIDPERLKATVLDRATIFYEDLAETYSLAGNDYISRLTEYRYR
jgi:hypothetical protein